jgi:hypothetical protein
MITTSRGDRMSPDFPENPTMEKMLYELRLVRWHMEFQIKENKQEGKWQEYLRLVDKHSEVHSYLESLAK